MRVPGARTLDNQTMTDHNTNQPLVQPQQQQPLDTGNGFLTGNVQPAQPRMAGEWNGQQPQQPQPQQQQPQPQYFTAEDIERARQQEKDKLYERIEQMGTQLQTVLTERETQQQERDRLAQEAEAARREKEESEMDLRALLEKRDQEWENRFKETESKYATDRAIFERERELAQVSEYRRDRVEQEKDFIIPAMWDMVTGNTPEEVEASIEFLKARSEVIASNFAAATQQSQQQAPFRGAAMPSVPPVGPMEQLPSNMQVTDDLVRGMSMDQYKANRETLLRMTNPNNRRG